MRSSPLLLTCCRSTHARWAIRQPSFYRTFALPSFLLLLLVTPSLHASLVRVYSLLLLSETKSISATMAEKKQTVILTTSDDEQFTVEKIVAERSAMIKSMMEGE